MQCEHEDSGPDYDGTWVTLPCVRIATRSVRVVEAFNPEPPHRPYVDTIHMCEAHYRNAMTQAALYMAQHRHCSMCDRRANKLGVLYHTPDCSYAEWADVKDASLADDAVGARLNRWLDDALLWIVVGTMAFVAGASILLHLK